MKVEMFMPKSETEDIILSMTKNCATLIEQTQTKPQEPVEFHLTQSKKKMLIDTTLESICRAVVDWINKFRVLQFCF